MASADTEAHTRLVPSALEPPCRSILLNGPNSPPMVSNELLRPLNTHPKARTEIDARSISPGLSSGVSSSEDDVQPATPVKLTFATPLPSSGKRRANSITLGVAARAQMLHAQNGGQPVVRTAPVQPGNAPWYQTGTTPPDVYTVSDAKAGAKKMWSKLKRSRSSSREAAVTPAAIPEEQSISGETTPRPRASPPASVNGQDSEELGPMMRRASADPRRKDGQAKHNAIWGFDAPLASPVVERTHDHTAEYDTEVWRSNPASDDASSTTSGDESTMSRQTDGTDEEEEEEPLDEIRKTSTAASIELVERQKREAR